MGAPLVVLIIAFGRNIGLLLLVLAATSQALLEFYRLTLPESRSREKAAGITLGLVFPLGAHFGQVETLLAILALAIVLLFLLAVAKPEDMKTVMAPMAVTLFGMIYVGFLLSHVLLLGKQSRGILWVFFLLITVWTGDTVAYFTGTVIGKHKLYPKISPKKSVEGLLGGLGGSVIAALLFRVFFLPDVPWSYALFLAFFIMLIGQVGDFGESMIKRSADVKDSSHVIPGHGGVLDRLDSFLFSAPFLYYCVLWLGR